MHPRYDSAKDVIYPALEAQLLDAIRMLELSTADAKPTTDDLIYGGHTEQWDKFAHTLLLRIYLRQGPSGQAKAAALYGSDDQFIVANDDNALVQFPVDRQRAILCIIQPSVRRWVTTTRLPPYTGIRHCHPGSTGRSIF